MIIDLIIYTIVALVSAIFTILPVVTIADFPLIGSNVSSTLTTAALTWNAFIATFPYAEEAWNIFIYVIIPFELLMLTGKFFFGHRLPAHNTN